jgi:hypothetical protein
LGIFCAIISPAVVFIIRRYREDQRHAKRLAELMAKLLSVLLLLCVPALADIQTFQVTIGSGKNTPIVSGGSPFLCRWVVFQNNNGHNLRIGDLSVTTTRGFQLTPIAYFLPPISFPPQSTTTNLNVWYVAGTPGDVLDVACDGGQ